MESVEGKLRTECIATKRYNESNDDIRKAARRRVCSLQFEKRRVQRTIRKLVREHGEQKNVMRRNEGRVARSADTRFIGIEMYIRRAMSK